MRWGWIGNRDKFDAGLNGKGYRTMNGTNKAYVLSSDPKIYQKALEFVRAHPGTQKLALIRHLGLKTNSAEAMLANMESHGLYLYENQYGQLWAFTRCEDE
jgi:hypothetical protein